MAQWETDSIDSGLQTLKLAGSWGVERAEQLHGLFMQGMNGEHALQVDLKDVEDVDLSFFQIVSAAYKSLPKGRLRFVQVPSHIADKAEQAGFIPRHGGDVFLERSV
jgi:anti-anti-sigma regulatory factor